MKSATLSDQIFHINFFDDPEYGILDTGLTDHCVTFVENPFYFLKNDDTEPISTAFLSFLVKVQGKLFRICVQLNCKIPISIMTLTSSFKINSKTIQDTFEQCNPVKKCKKQNL